MARDLFKKAVELDPEYGYAWGGLAATHLIDVLGGRSESPTESFRLFSELNKKALKYDPVLSCSLANEGFFYLLQREFDKAIIAGEKAVSMNPSDDLPYHRLAHIMRQAGQFDISLSLIKDAMRHNPYYPAYYLSELVNVYRDLGQYEDALIAAQQLLVRAQKGEYVLWTAHFHLVLIYSLLNRENEAIEHKTELLKMYPSFSMEWVKQYFSRSKKRRKGNEE